MSKFNIIIQNRKSVDEIPVRISKYVKRYFVEANLKDIKKVKENGRVYYQLDIVDQYNFYRLKFHSNGLLMQKVMEPFFDNIPDETGVGN